MEKMLRRLKGIAKVTRSMLRRRQPKILKNAAKVRKEYDIF